MMKRLGMMVLALAFGGVIPPVAAAETPGAAAVQPTESQRWARDKLLEMGRLLGGTQKFTLKLRAGFDVTQANGQKIEFGERREISLQRPGHFLSVQRHSDGRRDLMMFDGEKITVSDSEANVYARAEQPGDIDASVMYFVRDLGMRMPIAPLFMSRFAEELERRVLEVDYVEETDVLGATAHHIAGRTELVDFQVWIQEGKTPLPLRMILSYRNEPDHPQFWVDFSDWNLKPRFARNTFRFEPPKGSREIVMVAQLVPVPVETAPAPAASEEDKP